LALIVVLGAIYLVLNRRWRDVRWLAAGFTAAGLVAIALSYMRFGSLQPWFGWWDTFNYLSQASGFRVEWCNFSGCLWIRESTGLELFYPIMVAMGAICVAVMYLRIRARGGAQ